METKPFKLSFNEFYEPYPKEQTKPWMPYYKRSRDKTYRINLSPSLKMNTRVKHKLTLTHNDVQLEKGG